ncbi:transcriptional regulator, GntR family [Sphingobium chlorophenolicum L-1]|uniref:Transcriptional regulator, GntR family n=1 Tax=Sphingobium chlorophenolicum L-1 TaxID=690566 RepID=F6F3E7_SPHCR|nr:GntR family transcriptional regulator [Sphingobium chlorophenolicum]AEG50959.1 transcriptional regulator, GntR family [Sphingobium chlorophenolicum L-1]
MNNASPAPPLTDQPETAVREVIVRDVVRGLYEGRYEPGQRLREAELTQAYGVSRGPVREALNVLAARNIVELTPQRGARLRVLPIGEAIDTLVVAQNLVGLAARLAARNHDDAAGRARLQAALDAHAAFPPEGGGAELAVARDNFYGALTAMAANIQLSRILPSVHIHLIRVQFRPMLRINDAGRHRDYQRIVDAVFAGRERESEGAARAHFERGIERLRGLQQG